ncbi:hypothetical protein [Pedobacter sp.]|uniref:hypothetical protein n=1 Tax=Pedobacter sp. TaxID=1411316 RepID=UPI003BA891FA
MSELTEHITWANRRFTDDLAAKDAFSHIMPLNQVSASGYDAAFYPGGHGPIWDLAKDNDNGLLILDFLDSEKPVALVCHGHAALISVEGQRPGFMRCKRLFAFSDIEEKLVGRAGNVPYLLQETLVSLERR